MGKVIRQAVILVIPIAGQISLLGWLMLNYDNVRNNRWQMAPVGFHFRRGFRLFGVLAVYGLVVTLPAWLLSVIAALFLRQSPGTAGLLVFLGQLYTWVAVLVLLLLTPALVVATLRRGFVGAIDLAVVWRLATADLSSTLLAGLVVLGGAVIAVTGLIACFVGVLLTATYSTVVVAGAAAWLDRATAEPLTEPGVSAL
jgi:hypothetical protein